MGDERNRYERNRFLQPPPASIGAGLDAIDTPALLIDLDAFERNLRRMSDAAVRSKTRLRPHAKTHKSPIIAAQQIALGAVGVCCQKVSEAEIMVRGGVKDVLVSNEIAGANKLRRLAALARDARIGVCVDDIANVAEIASAAEALDVQLSVLVEIDVGSRRCGVTPEQAVPIALAIAKSNALSFGGLQAYHGRAQHMRTMSERREAIAGAATLTRRALDLLNREGLRCDIVTGAGTGTYALEMASGVYNEIQAGSYIFMDADYSRNRKEDGSAFDAFEHALFVLSTVMSRPDPTRAIVDAGLKSFSIDSGMPVLFGHSDLIYQRPSDEHGVLSSEGGKFPQRGENILLIPGHCDPTINLHDWYVCVRNLHGQNPRVEDIWPVAARGAIF